MNIEIKNSQKPVKYDAAIKFMENRLDDLSHKKCKELIWVLEHNELYTAGTSSKESEILDKSIKIIKTNRGGKITYHGPGQLVGYPIINLNNYKKSITWYMRVFENIIIESLREYNIFASRKEGLTGVWVEDEKICAMGVRLSRWVTMHGFALNLKPNMKYYDGMIPCGIQEFGVTSMHEILGKNVVNYEVMDIIANNFIEKFKV